MSTISLRMMQRVLDAGPAVPKLLEEALPGIDRARTQLDELATLVGRAADDGTGAPIPMDTPWSEAANARHAVSSTIADVQGALGKVEANVINRAEPGPPSPALDHALDAIAELDLAQAHLGKTLRPWVGQFGGAHAQLQPRYIAAADDNLGRAKRAIEASLRRHVNPHADGAGPRMVAGDAHARTVPTSGRGTSIIEDGVDPSAIRAPREAGPQVIVLGSDVSAILRPSS